MNTPRKGTRCCSTGVSLAALLVAAGGLAFAQADAPMPGAADKPVAVETPESTIQAWPKDVQALARVLIARYGEPGKFNAMEMTWSRNGPWLTTVLHRTGFTQSAMGTDSDHLQQSITYKVPAEKLADVRKFDKRISVNQATDELSSRADTESMNYLALNLVDDIVKGQRSELAARAFYEKVKVLESMGKSSPYLDGLMFAAKNEKAGMPDKSSEQMPIEPNKNLNSLGYPKTDSNLPNP
ncbi:MAG: hypothetical protein ACHQ49_10945 [Elusimicrobiota bacterium]